ncbi:MAG: hypothetical protein PSV22_20605 [Pseudolabrys sp.]|nr:hypothetical protein [Pseudolabrys sp.]
MAKRKKPDPTAGKAEYQATAQEKAVLRKQKDRRAAAPVAPRVKVSKDEKSIIELDHPNDAVAYGILMEALGTADFDFVTGLLSQLANAGSQGGQVDERGLNFMVSVIKDIKPRDQLEAMLAAQMAAIHMTTMTFVRRLAHVENILQQDSAGNTLNKLTRTYATQMETLKRYRTGGEQKVTVQHVTVSEGGQAIVGNVTQTPRENAPGQATASLLALADTKTAPMPTLDERTDRALIPARRKAK